MRDSVMPYAKLWGVAAIEDLIAVSSGPLSTAPVGDQVRGSVELARLLGVANGFYAFVSALHVLPAEPTENEYGVAEWNAPGLWREAYPDVDSSWLFFAEDAFGCQFALGRTGVSVFDPETGEFAGVAPNLDGWAEGILRDHRNLTGWPIAHEWQSVHGPLRAGRRLVPKIPFVLGGEFTVENLYDADTVTSLRARGHVAAQIRDHPDGTTVRFSID